MIIALVVAASVMSSCEILDNDPDKHLKDEDTVYVSLDEVAAVLSNISLGSAQLNEVHNAVSSSSGNGYDEEYTMRNLFTNPGTGIGETQVKSSVSYDRPLKDLIEEYLRAEPQVKSENAVDPDRFMKALTESDIQIYWPYSENWDGEQMPVITFDPEDGAEANIGYRFTFDEEGLKKAGLKNDPIAELYIEDRTIIVAPITTLT